MDMQNVSTLQIPEGQVRNIHNKDSKLLWGKVSYETKYKGGTLQNKYSGAQLLTKDGFATPITDTAFWQTFSSEVLSHTPGSNGWSTIAKIASGWGNFQSYISATKDFVVSSTYTLIVELKNVTGTTGNITLIQTGQTQDPFSSFEVIQGASGTSGTNAVVNFSSPDPVSVIKVTTKSSFASNTRGLRFFVNNTASVGNKFDIRVTVLAGDHSSDWQDYYGDKWQPYVGNAPSPSPDYPQTVQSVTGQQTVTITGKNLLKPYQTSGSVTANAMTFTMLSDGSISVHGTASANTWLEFCGDFKSPTSVKTTPIIELDPEATYTMSSVVKSGTVSSSMLIYMQKDYPNTEASSQLGQTRQITDATGVYRAWLRISSGTVFNHAVLQIQLEKGASSSPYEFCQFQDYTVNLGSIELRKINAYQDYIYKSGDDWYVHKEVGSITYDGTEEWEKSNAGWFYVAAQSASSLNGVANASLGYSNHYIFDSTQTAPNGFLFGNNNYIQIKHNGITTTSDYADWVSSNNVIVCYPLATPTNTKITDSTLIGQLNNVERFLPRYGYGSLVHGSLPVIIDRTSL